jgi:N-acetylneuraminic acid mutarotase
MGSVLQEREMLNPIWRRYLRHLSSALTGSRTPRRGAKDRWAIARRLDLAQLEELESRLAPASFAVDAQYQVTLLSEPEALARETSPAHAVVFFESSVANYQILRQGLDAGTDDVLLDSGGDGLRMMAAFLAARHDLSSIGVVAHGEPGRVVLGSGALDGLNLGNYAHELAVLGSALRRGGEFDLWSCAVAAGPEGASLVRNLTVAMGAGVAASSHLIGSASQGGNWQLDVRAAGARGEVPFSESALGAFDEVLAAWSGAASMATPRSNAWTMTPLNDGQVLVTSGFDRGVYVANAERYNPLTNTWSAAGALATPRALQTATLLGNGKVLVAGGNNSAFLSSAELYDPASNTWTAAASMATARTSHTATRLANGKVLVAGGNNSAFLSSAELYDPASNVWSPVTSMAAARTNYKATLLGNGKVLVMGGVNGAGMVLNAELYDPASNTWSSAGSIVTGRVRFTVTLLSNGKVLIAGGSAGSGSALSSAELYDPATNSWSSAGSMVTPRDSATATLLGNGKVLVAGGCALGYTSGFQSSAELYDPLTNTWSATASMATARDHHKATLLNNGKVLVAGGWNGSSSGGFFTPLSSTELYDPGLLAANTTTALTATPNASTGGQLVTFTATVGPSPGNLGTVTFFDNATVLAANVPVSGGVAAFQTAALTVGTHPISASYSGASGFNGSTSNTVSYVVSAGAPHVVSVTVNGNIASLAGPQRSRVVSLVVVFDQPVQLDTNALTLAPHTNNVVFGGVAQPAGFGALPTSLVLASSDNITWVVTFSGNTEMGLDGLNSLQDGVYDFNISAAKVHPFGVPGVTMAANSTTTVHRLFGDTNAPGTPVGGVPGADFEAVVNTGDNLVFRGAFNSAASYKAYLDFNGDGTIDSGDNLQFRNRFNKTLTWSV